MQDAGIQARTSYHTPSASAGLWELRPIPKHTMASEENKDGPRILREVWSQDDHILKYSIPQSASVRDWWRTIVSNVSYWHARTIGM